MAIEAMSEHCELWDDYFSDFSIHRMRLESGTKTSIVKLIFERFFEQLHQSQCMLERIVKLHAHVHVHQLDLAKLAGAMRPLTRIQNVICS